MSQRFKQSEQWQPLVRLFAQGKDDEAFKPVLWIGAGLSVAAGYPTT